MTTDKEVAKLIGLSPTNFNNRKKRGSLISTISEWAVDESVDIQWLLTGVDDMRGQKTDKPSAPEITSTAPETAYIKAIEPVIPDIRIYLESLSAACKVGSQKMLVSTLEEMLKAAGKHEEPTHASEETHTAEVHNIKDIGHQAQYEPVHDHEELRATGTDGGKKNP
ncbi:MAG: bacteriophage CI repressor [Desulfobacteraceae bacterium]|nr:bacteriophage CI repressor [Desulfobacteraceae bacterium]